MSSAEGIVPPLAAAAAPASEAPAATPPRRRLFRKYALLFVGAGRARRCWSPAASISGSPTRRTRRRWSASSRRRRTPRPQRIEEFVDEIQRQIGWTTHAQWAAGPLDQRRQDYFRLLRQVPAITELTQLDATGREQLKVSRLAMDAIGSERGFLAEPGLHRGEGAARLVQPGLFPQAIRAVHDAWRWPIDGRNAGVTVAEINLKLIWDVITALKIGQGGYAYVVDARGRLIAHPDISLVLRDTDLSHLPQVAAALSPRCRMPGAARRRAADGRDSLGRATGADRACARSRRWAGSSLSRCRSARPSRRSTARHCAPRLLLVARRWLAATWSRCFWRAA